MEDGSLEVIADVNIASMERLEVLDGGSPEIIVDTLIASMDKLEMLNGGSLESVAEAIDGSIETLDILKMDVPDTLEGKVSDIAGSLLTVDIDEPV